MSKSEVCNFEKIHTLVTVRFWVCFESHQQELCVLLRSFGYAFFCFMGGGLLTEKDYIKNYIKDVNEREERVGKYRQPWEDDENNYEDKFGTIGLLRELYTYKKMYEQMHNIIVRLVNECKDTAIKEDLTKCLIDAEQVYVTRGVFPPDYMSSEEFVIAYLLSYIRKNNIKFPEGYENFAFFKESLDWLDDLGAKYEMARVLFGYDTFSKEDKTSFRRNESFFGLD